MGTSSAFPHETLPQTPSDPCPQPSGEGLLAPGWAHPVLCSGLGSWGLLSTQLLGFFWFWVLNGWWSIWTEELCPNMSLSSWKMQRSPRIQFELFLFVCLECKSRNNHRPTSKGYPDGHAFCVPRGTALESTLKLQAFCDCSSHICNSAARPLFLPGSSVEQFPNSR